MTTKHVSAQDIVVLGCLAGLFCWIYIVLPLAFYRT
jgi:hypothetical protein